MQASLPATIRDILHFMNPLIREYRQEDRPALVLLMEELQDHLVMQDSLHLRRRLPEYGESYTAEMLELVATHEGVIFVAEAEGKVVGCISGTIERSATKDPLEWIPHTTGRIQELHVSDGFRSLGIGGALMEKMEEYFKEHQCNVARTEVLSDNKRAYEFYQRMGYQDRYVDVIKRL